MIRVRADTYRDLFGLQTSTAMRDFLFSGIEKSRIHIIVEIIEYVGLDLLEIVKLISNQRLIASALKLIG